MIARSPGTQAVLREAKPEELAQTPGLTEAAEAGIEAPVCQSGSRPRPSPAHHGPLVAVCALCGGAGASTLTYLIAQSAALDPDSAGGPVLALDAGGTTGGLALYSRAASARSLAELADEIRAGHAPSAPIFATAARGVRLIATTPRLQPEPDLERVSRVFADAREAHRMTVVDCGTLSLSSERLALELATHVVWVLPATEHGLSRARLSPWTVVPPDVVQVLVARNNPSARRASTRALAQLAEARDATLVLMPHVKELDRDSFDAALEICGVTLQAIATKLRQ